MKIRKNWINKAYNAIICKDMIVLEQISEQQRVAHVFKMNIEMGGNYIQYVENITCAPSMLLVGIPYAIDVNAKDGFTQIEWALECGTTFDLNIVKNTYANSVDIEEVFSFEDETCTKDLSEYDLVVMH